jgi:hypothetical protein
MVLELLASDYSVSGVDTSAQGIASYHERARILEEKIGAHDPGFIGAVAESTRSSALLHSMERGTITPHMRMDARDYDGGYDWRDDAERYHGLYPKELFIGSHSGEQSRRAMARYDADMYRAMAVGRRPVAAFIGNMVGFGIDLFAVKSIPFIGGLSSAAGRSAASTLGNSILRGAVADSIAFSLDVSEVELARALMDERVTLNDVVEHLPEEIMYSALLGGTLGLVGGAVKGRGKSSPTHNSDVQFKKKIVEQIRGGTQLPAGNAIGNGTYHSMEEYGAEVARLAKEYHGRLQDVAPHVTADHLDTFIRVAGGVEEHSCTTMPAQNALSRLAVDPTTRA